MSDEAMPATDEVTRDEPVRGEPKGGFLRGPGVLLLVLLLAVLVRLPGLDTFGYGVDEGNTASEAIRLVDVHGWKYWDIPSRSLVPLSSSMPLSYYLAAVGLETAGRGLVGLRIPFLVLGLLSLVLTWLLARRLTGSDAVAGLAVLYLALNPAHIAYSQLARFYMPTLVMALWFVLALDRLIRRPGIGNAALLAVATAAGFLTHHLFALVGPIAGLMILLALWRPTVENTAGSPAFLTDSRDPEGGSSPLPRASRLHDSAESSRRLAGSRNEDPDSRTCCRRADDSRTCLGPPQAWHGERGSRESVRNAGYRLRLFLFALAAFAVASPPLVINVLEVMSAGHAQTAGDGSRELYTALRNVARAGGGAILRIEPALVLLSLVGAVIAFRRLGRGGLLLVLMSFVLGLEIFGAGMFGQIRGRYIIWCLPYFAILAAVATRWTLAKAPRGGSAVVIAALAVLALGARALDYHTHGDGRVAAGQVRAEAERLAVDSTIVILGAGPRREARELSGWDVDRLVMIHTQRLPNLPDELQPLMDRPLLLVAHQQTEGFLKDSGLTSDPRLRRVGTLIDRSRRQSLYYAFYAWTPR